MSFGTESFIMKKNVSMQEKFEKAMVSGKILTRGKLEAMGFANVYDPIYKARLKGFNVIRSIKSTRAGDVTQYSLSN